MAENETNITPWEARFTESDGQIANMDEFDYLTMLMESRIIEAS